MKQRFAIVGIYNKVRLSRRSGFTLVELMIAVAIIGILVAVGVSWRPMRSLQANARMLYSDLQMVKMEAIRRNSRNVVMAFNVVPCPGLPGSVPSPGGGYSVFVDDGAGGGVAGDKIRNGSEGNLAQVDMPQGVALCAQTFAGGVTGFLPTGMPSNAGSVTLNKNGGGSAVIRLSLTGGIKIE